MIFFCTALTLWGQDALNPKGSAGIGLFFSNDFNSSVECRTGGGPGVGPGGGALPGNLASGGFYAYGDFIYAEIICGMFFGGGKGPMFFLGADLGIYGKYPFVISEKLCAFPLLGFEFAPVLYANYNGRAFVDFFASVYERHVSWKQFWFNTGAGLDMRLNGTFLLRFEALYGLRLKTGSVNYLIDRSQLTVNNGLGHGLTLRVALGI